MKLLVTGGCGFIGCNYIRLVLNTCQDVQIVNIDKLSYAGNADNLKDCEGPRYRFVRGDICDADLVDRVVSEGFDAILNFAAESHVDRSIHDPASFIQSNVFGTFRLLEAARKHKVKRFLQVSTDEVYGSLGETGVFYETTNLDPSSPYSASKAGADLLVRAYQRTFGLDAVLTRSSNNYGPYQHPEKFIPLFTTNALEGRECPLYGDGKNVRDWLYVDDNARGIHLALTKGRTGEVYNLGGGNERPNIEVAQAILKVLGRPESLIKFVKDRPGHDRRYALDCSKARSELGFVPQTKFEDGLRTTVLWYRDHQDWVRAIKSSKDFEQHVKRTYR